MAQVPTRLLVAVVAAWGVAAPAAALDAAQTTRLAKGDVITWTEEVKGSDVPAAMAVAVIDAAPEAVWPHIDRCGDWVRYMPNIKQSDELSRAGAVGAQTVQCKVTVDLPFPLPDLTTRSRAQHTIEPGKRWRRQWQMIEGDYTMNEGTWTLEPFEGGKTLATYRIRAQPKIPLPDSLVKSAQTKTLPDVMHRLRARVAKP